MLLEISLCQICHRKFAPRTDMPLWPVCPLVDRQVEGEKAILPLTYTVATAATDTTKIEATTAQAAASVEIAYNGANVRNDGTITLLKDGAAHPITVTVRNGNAVKVYTINITRAGG